MVTVSSEDVGTLGTGPATFSVGGHSYSLGWLCCGSKHIIEHNVMAHEIGHALVRTAD